MSTTVPPLTAATAALLDAAAALGDARQAVADAEHRYQQASDHHRALALTAQHERGLHDYEALHGCPVCRDLAALDPTDEAL